MGFWQHPTAGRPGQGVERVWIPRCNFVLKIVATTQALDASSSGWVVHITMEDPSHKLDTNVFINCDQASSTSVLRKRLMKANPGLIARLTSEDFFEFVEADSCKKLPTVYISTRVGLVNVAADKQFWAFSDRIFDSSGHALDNGLTSLMVDAQSPYSVRSSLSGKCVGKSTILKLGDMTRKYFKSRSIHALHVYSTVLKAILKTQIMEKEHMLPITNLSGPPNIGKTFASAIALRMLGSDTMMLSRATPSALLDVCDHHVNMLVVWDDPRDATEKQMCSIVHEAFHGFPNTTVTKGLRKYNSSIIIGTQRALLGLPELAIHTPTFSRLAHIDMNIETEESYKDASFSADNLAKCMEGLEGIFPVLLKHEYSKNKTDKYYAILQKKASSDIIDRAIRVASIEWNLCHLMNDMGFGFKEKDIDHYFSEVYMEFLKRHCNRMTPLQQFIKDCKEHLSSLASTDIKLHVYADLKCIGTSECVAFHLKSVFSTLKSRKRNGLNYTIEGVQAEVKANKEYGEMSHNVNYKDGKDRYITRRSMVIRKCFWDGL